MVNLLKANADVLGVTAEAVHFDDNISRTGDALSMTVELLYQTLSYPFAADLANTNTDLVTRFMGLYNPADNVPVVLASAQIP